MKLKLLGLSLLCLVNYAVAQKTPTCGTKLDRKAEQLLKKFKSTSYRTHSNGEMTPIAISAHIVRRSNGSGGLTEIQLEDAITNVNNYYSNAELSFFLLGEINYIDDDTYFDFVGEEEGSLGSENDVANTINIYFVNTINDGSLCGYAYFPGSADRILMANPCAVNGSTLPHEIGHYFTLYHTHGKTNTGTTDELVDGSNCVSAGDDICDTAADPNLSGLVDSSCNYTGTATDANGDTYEPDPHNIMSYSTKACRDVFTVGQYERIMNGYSQFRSYLITTDYFANFKVGYNSACKGSSVTFESTSYGAVSYYWEFEGGEPATSTDENPLVTYNQSGVFDVSLTITNDQGEQDTKSRVDYISIIDPTEAVATEALYSFEDGSNFNYEIENEDERITFDLTNTASYDGANSVFVNFYEYGNQGEIDYLKSEMINTSDNADYFVSFDYAYTYYDATYQDGLELVYKTVCSNEWVTFWSKFGDELATIDPLNSPFIPNSEDWAHVEISIGLPSDPTQIAFKTTNGYGNNLYIDNFTVALDPNPIIVNHVEITEPVCSGDSGGELMIEASLNDETIYYSLDNVDFSTSNTFTGLSAGTYNVYMTSSGGGSKVVVIEIGEPEEFTTELDIEHPICTDDENGSINISVTGGTGSIQYSLNDGGFGSDYEFNNLTNGSYAVTFKDSNGCLGYIDAVLVDQNITPNQPTIRQLSDGSRLYIDATSYDIQWYLDEALLENGTNTEINLEHSGSYQVSLTNAGLCTVYSEPFIIASTNDIDSDNFAIYPVPANNSIYVESYHSVGSIKMKISDNAGKVIKVYELDQHREKLEIDLHDLLPGFYLISIEGGDHQITKRFLKN